MKALVLLSGGLDSLLALRLLERQGVQLECVHFVTGFNHARYRDAVERGVATGGLPPTRRIDIRPAYLRRVALDVATERRDPCVSCRILMLERAAEIADASGIELLATGEVVGQRVRGQCRADLVRIEREAGVEGRVLRPLSAGFLATDALARHAGPEQCALLERIGAQGRVQGRSRRAQFELARSLSIAGYPVPSGGCCRLTDPRFVRRLQDEAQHRAAGGLAPGDLGLLAVGRHFRLDSGLKAVLGRDQGESATLLDAAGESWWFRVESGRGAVGLLIGARGAPGAIGFEEVARLAVRYSAEREADAVRVVFHRPGQRRVVLASAAAERDLAALRI